MIRNDRQYGIVRGRAERLRRLRSELLDRDQSDGDRTRTELELAAVEAELKRMDAELGEYDALKSGEVQPETPKSLSDLPRALIQARIAAGLTQAALAERLGLKEQQIQRYESTNYESASLSRLTAIAEVLGLRFTPNAASELATKTVDRGLRKIGFDSDLVARRFGDPSGAAGAVEVVGRIAHVYGWLPERVVSGQVDLDIGVHAAAYKRAARANEGRTRLLAGYARFLTTCVRGATRQGMPDLPSDPIVFGNLVAARGTGVFEPVLTAAWEAGLPVVPLAESGGFDAALWSEAGRPVIVLNSRMRTEAHWAFHLMHEIGHVVRGDDAVVEGALGVVDDREERGINEWASAALLGGRGDELFDAVMSVARGNMGLMQRAVGMVARREDIDDGVLALHTAFRLAEQGTDWWGAASNMVRREPDPWQLARDVLIDRIDWNSLSAVDADLLARALNAFPLEGR